MAATHSIRLEISCTNAQVMYNFFEDDLADSTTKIIFQGFQFQSRAEGDRISCTGINKQKEK